MVPKSDQRLCRRAHAAKLLTVHAKADAPASYHNPASLALAYVTRDLGNLRPSTGGAFQRWLLTGKTGPAAMGATSHPEDMHFR